jgi:catechol 2,3-dioxygenase-like lactoylglutathione lyase family enzyme
MTFAHLTLATRDAMSTSRFFQDMFGWRSLRQPDNVDVTADWLEIAEGQQIHILEIEGFEVSAFEQEYGRHLALFHPGDDYAALQARLQSAGVTLIDPIRATPFPRFFFRDPNGYMIEVIDAEKYRSESVGP